MYYNYYFRYHFVDIWVEELLRVGGSKSNVGKPAPTEIVNRLVFCWAKTAALTNIGAFRQKIKQNILEELIERSEVKYETKIKIFQNYKQFKIGKKSKLECKESKAKCQMIYSLSYIYNWSLSSRTSV